MLLIYLSRNTVSFYSIILLSPYLRSDRYTKVFLTVPTVTLDAREPPVDVGEQQEDHGLTWFAMADHFPALPLQRWFLAGLEDPEDLRSTGGIQASRTDQ